MEKIGNILGLLILIYLIISVASYAQVVFGYDIGYSPFWHGPIGLVLRMIIGGG